MTKISRYQAVNPTPAHACPTAPDPGDGNIACLALVIHGYAGNTGAHGSDFGTWSSIGCQGYMACMARMLEDNGYGVLAPGFYGGECGNVVNMAAAHNPAGPPHHKFAPYQYSDDGHPYNQNGCCNTYAAPPCLMQSKLTHSINAPIEDLAYHMAWYIWPISYDGNYVDIVAHSMGGLIARHMLMQVEAKNERYPPYLHVQNVVTIATPHMGGTSPWGSACTGNRAFVMDFEMAQMCESSEFMDRLDEFGQNPAGAGQGNGVPSAVYTQFDCIGSPDDSYVTAYSATKPYGCRAQVYDVPHYEHSHHFFPQYYNMAFQGQQIFTTGARFGGWTHIDWRQTVPAPHSMFLATEGVLTDQALWDIPW